MLEEKLGRGAPITDELILVDELIEATDKIKISPLPLLPLEIALLTLAIEDSGGGVGRPKVETPAQSASQNGSSRSEMSASVQSAPVQFENKPRIENAVITESVIQSKEIEDKGNIVVQNYDGPLASIDKIKLEWMNFINGMSASNGSLAGMLRLVSPVDVKGKSLTLSVTSRFQQDMLERDVKKKVIEEQMTKIWGPMTFKCVLGEKGPERTMPEPQDVNVEPVNNEEPEDKGIIGAAEKIFGS